VYWSKSRAPEYWINLNKLSISMQHSNLHRETKLSKPLRSPEHERQQELGPGRERAGAGARSRGRCGKRSWSREQQVAVVAVVAISSSNWRGEL